MSVRVGVVGLALVLVGAVSACGSDGSGPPAPPVTSSSAPVPEPSVQQTPTRFPQLAVDAVDPCTTLGSGVLAQLALAVAPDDVPGVGPGQSCAFVDATGAQSAPVVTVRFEGDVSLPEWAAAHDARYPAVRSAEYTTVVSYSDTTCTAAVAVTPDQVVSVERATEADDERSGDCDGGQVLLLAVQGGLERANGTG